MRFVIASYGTRGDVEPGVVVGHELLRRGHEVLMAVSPNLVGFAQGAGLAAISYGLDTKALLEVQRKYWTCYYRTPWKVKELTRMGRETQEFGIRCWQEMTTTLAAVSGGADLLLTGQIFEQPAVNVAESCGIPLATLHWFPVRVHGLMQFLPGGFSRMAMRLNDWLVWRGTKNGEDAQRRGLGLPKAAASAPSRIAKSGSLEIQAYDEVCFPGLAAEWAKHREQRPFVGALAMALGTDADGEVLAWIAEGSPPICFAFGSMAVDSPADVISMIAQVCTKMGERALVCSGSSDYSSARRYDHVQVTGLVNYATVFPACRAVVHHGGAGTTAAAWRAGVPQLILWTLPDQPLFAAQLKRLEVGSGRRFSTTTEKSLATDLSRILGPKYAARARELATQITRPADSAVAAADRLENFARLGCAG